jgi:hypothetical protein
MRLVTTILVGGLVLGTTMFACSSDSDDDGTSAGGSTGATGGKGGSTAGTGGSTAGTGGGSAIACDTQAGIDECKRRASSSIACTALSNCGCENCTCQLEECEADPGCIAVRECVIRTKCCATTDPTNCPAGAPDCTDADAGTAACSAEVAAAGAGLQLVLALGQCIATERQSGNTDCAYCP